MKIAYNNDIAQCMVDLIRNPVSGHISKYDDKFRKKITGTYVYAGYKKEISPNYEFLIDSRNALSVYGTLDFNSSKFCEDAVNFLNSVCKLFGLYLSQKDEQCPMVDVCLLKKIIEGDVCPDGDDRVSVGLGNPLILQALIVAKYQIDDFDDCYRAENSCDVAGTARRNIYREHLLRRMEKLIRDVMIEYDGEFYGIVGYDSETVTFVAAKDKYVENRRPVSALSLYENIARSVCGRSSALERGTSDEDGSGGSRPTNVVIVGETFSNSFDLLKRMTEGLGVNIKQVCAEDYEDGRLSGPVLDELLSEYDDIYFLDCPDAYSPIVASTRYEHRPIMGSRRAVERDLTVNDFKGSNRGGAMFLDLYYYVQGLFFGYSRFGANRPKTLNNAFLDYLMKEAGSADFYFGAKRMYVYVSGRVNLDGYSGDCFGKFCTEINKSNGYSVLEAGRRVGIGVSRTRRFDMTYFDILSAISPSYEFYCRMTDVKVAGPVTDDDVIKAVERAHDTRIEIRYGDVADENGKSIDLEVRVSYCGETVSDEYRTIVETAVGEMFTVRNKSTEEDPRGVGSLANSHEAVMDAVLYKRSRSFNDMLFYHLYAGDGEDGDDIRFDLRFVPYDSDGKRHDDNRADQIGSICFSKYVAEYLMNNMDGKYYRESCIVDQLRIVGSSRPKLDRYVNHLSASCEELGYTDSMLFHRLHKYF